MIKEKRQNQAPIPADLNEHLSLPQQLSLSRIEAFGWELQFVRRPLFQQPIPFIKSADGTQIAIIEENGNVNSTTPLKLRGTADDTQREQSQKIH